MKIYVGNLPFSVDDKKLEELFSQYGNVEDVQVIKDKFSGRSKGFGFLTINDNDSAKKAISEMNEKEFEGRKLTVNECFSLMGFPKAYKKNISNGEGFKQIGNSVAIPMIEEVAKQIKEQLF